MEAATYYDIRIIRIPVGRIPTAGSDGDYHDGCKPRANVGESEALVDAGLSPWIELEDNGRCGDGVIFSVHRIDHTEEEDCSGFVDLYIPDRSLGLLIAALSSIQLMRRAEADTNARTIR